MTEDTKNIKFVFLGETGCGKTSIINRFISNSFNPDQESTIGANYFSKSLNFRGVNMKLNIWDTAGRDRYVELASLYSKQADVYIIVCQYNQYDPAQAIQKYYNKYIKDFKRDDSQILLLINKSDLKNPDSFESINEIEKQSDELRISVHKVSAKDNTEIQEVFEKLLERILKFSAAISRNSINLTTSQRSIAQKEEVKKKCC